MRDEAQERARERDLAWAEAFAGISRVAGNLASRLVQLHADVPTVAAEHSSMANGVAAQQRREPVARVARLPRGGYGPRQQAVLALRGLDQRLGMTSAEVAKATAISTTNAHTVLGGLAKLGASEKASNSLAPSGGVTGQRPQDHVKALLPRVLNADVQFEACPSWLLRPGRVEAGRSWSLLCQAYGDLTGQHLPEVAPPRERRRLDALVRYDNGDRQIIEVDESQHFTGSRAVTLATYPPDVALGFPLKAWLARAHERTGREPGGGFARPCPPLFPGAGGRHAQRAFRDMTADLLPLEHGWLPTIRISDLEVQAWPFDAEPHLTTLLRERGARLGG